jgi:ABC-2 type transport system ATP-binding protein
MTEELHADTRGYDECPIVGSSVGSMPSNPAQRIVLQKVSKRFPGTAAPVLEPLDIEITAGAVTGLVGPDGAGKTTLLRMLAGLLEPSEGLCRVAGLDPTRQGEDLHAILGYMPQRFGLYEDLSVQENLELYASLRDVHGPEKEEAFVRLLHFTQLERFTDRLAGKLSGGMKQKLGLACTLLGQPKVLLLDEPGVGVDPISRRELWSMVHELADSGMLIIWSTSYLDEAERCRDVLLLNQGALLYAGPPKDLTGRMAGRSYLLAAGSADKRRIQQKAVLVPEISDAVIQGASVRVIVRQSPTDAPSEQARPEAISESLGLPPSAMAPTVPRFEDAFIDLLGGGPSQESRLAAILNSRSSTGDAPIIEAKNLTKKFGSFTATDQVNFAVRQGEIFGLLGPNGAGKSTTFRMMCGLLKPSSGQALVQGLDLQKNPARVRQQLGYMAQKFSLYGGLSVEQNLQFFSGVYGLSGREQAARVSEMIETFNFNPILSRSADSLPLGFKQRLALACSLMHRPAILFLDEPTSGVDPLTRREFWLHINSMVEKGVTVMVTTHFMDEAEYCDRIGLVYQGKLIATGSPDDLKAQSRSPDLPDPGMEDAFIRLIERYDAEGGK